MTHTELNLRERRTIEDMLNAKMPVDKIAAEIGRHRSTVFREIRRSRFVDDELPNLNGYEVAQLPLRRCHGWSSTEGLPYLTFSHPVLSTERDQYDEEAISGKVGAKYHGEPMAAPAMSDQPSIEWRRQSNARERVG